jgi:serine/threonine protein kinase
MSDIDDTIQQCPNCLIDLSNYRQMDALPNFCLQCNFPLMTIAGKYRLQKIIGQGAVGTVYLAKHTKLVNNAERVVKLIKKELLTNPNTIQRFVREVQVTADLSERNEHIIRIYDDFGEIEHLGYFYVMEFVRGMTLRRFIHQQQALPSLAWCLEVMRQLCEALHTAHTAGVIHRDLKPDNLMITEKGLSSIYIKVLDWGIAKPMTLVDDNLTQGLVGTPHYMAPEQAMNLDLDARTDLYAVGEILYELLTGVNPYVAATGKRGKSQDSMIDLIRAHINVDPPTLDSIQHNRSDLTPDIERVIFKAMAKRPEQRHNSVIEFYQDLQQAMQNAGVAFQPADTGIFKGVPISPSLTGTGSPLPTGQGLANVNSNPPPYTSSLANSETAFQETLDGADAIVSHTPSQPSPSQPSQSKSTPVWVWGIAALLLLGSGVWAGAQWLRPQPPQPRTTPTTRRATPTKGIKPVWIKARTAPTTPDAKAQQPDTRKQTAPIPSPQPRNRPKQRPKKRPKQAPKKRPIRTKRSICPSKWRLLSIKPYLNRKAEITTEPGSQKRINARLLCISPNAKRVSIVQEGFAPCIFQVPNRSKLRIKLQNADSIGLAGQCLRTR